MKTQTPNVEKYKNDIREVVKLSPILCELDESNPSSGRLEIRESLYGSELTTHKKVNKSEEMYFASKNGDSDGYVLTDLGETVAERTTEYVSEVRAARVYEGLLKTDN